MTGDLEHVLAVNAQLRSENSALQDLQAQVRELRQKLSQSEDALEQARRTTEATKQAHQSDLAKWSKWKKWWKVESARFKPELVKELADKGMQPPSPELSSKRKDTKRRKLSSPGHTLHVPIASSSKMPMPAAPIRHPPYPQQQTNIKDQAGPQILVEDTQYDEHSRQAPTAPQPDLALTDSSVILDESLSLMARADSKRKLDRPFEDDLGQMRTSLRVSDISLPQRSGDSYAGQTHQRPTTPTRRASYDSQATEDTPTRSQKALQSSQKDGKGDVPIVSSSLVHRSPSGASRSHKRSGQLKSPLSPSSCRPSSGSSRTQSSLSSLDKTAGAELHNPFQTRSSKAEQAKLSSNISVSLRSPPKKPSVSPSAPQRHACESKRTSKSSRVDVSFSKSPYSSSRKAAVKAKQEVETQSRCTSTSDSTKKRKRIDDAADTTIEGDQSTELSREEEYHSMLKTIRKNRKAEIEKDPYKYKGRGAYARGLPRQGQEAINSRYEIDANQNGGMKQAYGQVVHKRDERKKMHGGDCHCCAGFSEFASKLTGADEQAYRDKYSKHRHHWEEPQSPPGYWNMGFPSTQEVEHIRERAKAQEAQKRARIEAEASRGGGRWVRKSIN